MRYHATDNVGLHAGPRPTAPSFFPLLKFSQSSYCLKKSQDELRNINIDSSEGSHSCSILVTYDGNESLRSVLGQRFSRKRRATRTVFPECKIYQGRGEHSFLEGETSPWEKEVLQKKCK